MALCYLCDALGIKTGANSPQPIIVDDKAYQVCVDCRNMHLRALELHARTMFDRLFPPSLRKVKARADTKPRVSRRVSVSVAVIAVKAEPDDGQG